MEKSLKDVRDKFDGRVLSFIKVQAPHTQLIHLTQGLGPSVPKELKESSKVRGPDAIMRILEGCLRRLKKSGKIQCIKMGLPYWQAVKE